MPRLALVALLAALLLAAAQPAGAATVGHTANDTLLFTGEGSERNLLGFDEDEDDWIVSDRPENPITPGDGCRDDGDPATTNVVLCEKRDIFTTFDLGAGDDEVAQSDVRAQFFHKGGPGRDKLRASTAVGGSVTMLGGEDRDEYFPGSPRNFEYVNYADKSEPLTITIDDVANDPDGEDVPSSLVGVGGGSGDDDITGSTETSIGDYLNGNGGDDVVRGLDGSDNVNGGFGGDDALDGGGGNDVFPSEPGADDIRGGSGFDRYDVYSGAYATRDVEADLDDQADDGRAGEGDNVHTDVEDLNGSPFAPGRVKLTGDGKANRLTGGFYDDTLDGGTGSDVLTGGFGADAVSAVDGEVDRIDCGPGEDRATVDQVDQVTDCETVDRRAAPAEPSSAGTVAIEDRPPSVRFVAPAADGLLAARPAAVAVEATDDRGVTRVDLVDDGRVVGTDTTAPYTFDYRPTGDDVGRNTLVAVAVDAAEQTGTAVRPVRVDRFLPAITAVVRTARDRRPPYRFRLTGALRLPAVLNAASACRGGIVSAQVKRGSRTISTRRARLTRSCGFASTVTFRDRRRLGDGRLKVTARFLGTTVLAPRTAPPVSVRAG